MKSEQEFVHEYLRLRFHHDAGFVLPYDLCGECARQLFAYLAHLETLDDLLTENHHVCPHTLTPLTILNVALNAEAELLEIVSHDIATQGWNTLPGYDTQADGVKHDDDDPEIIY